MSEERTDMDERDERLEDRIEDTPVWALRDEDPFADWFMPGYVTEMDYLNAQEADDYRHEFDGEDF
jgi:hypothetical protein